MSFSLADAGFGRIMALRRQTPSARQPPLPARDQTLPAGIRLRVMFARIRTFFSRSKAAPTKDGEAASKTAGGNTTGTSADAIANPLPEDPHAVKAWLALGLDGALATMSPSGLKGPIGEPVHNTVQRLRDWVEHRELRVKILTPRAATPEGVQTVRDWLRQHGLPALDVTAEKDLHMVEFWSAHCVQVISNTGQIVGGSPAGLDQPVKKAEEMAVAAGDAPAQNA